MDILAILGSKPVLIGLHVGFAIIGIDAFLWLLGKLKDDNSSNKSRIITATIGVVAFVFSWIFGGFYYVVYYGKLVKTGILAGYAPWAHNVVTETKEHVFLFIFPFAMTILFITLLRKEDMERLNLRRVTMWLVGAIAAFGLLIGAMGFIISAAARWGLIK